MSNSGREDLCDHVVNGAGVERIRILALCVAGANELGCRLEADLKQVQSVELMRRDLPGETLADYRSFLSNLFAKFRPSLLLLCLPGGSIDCAEAIFDAIRKSRQELSVVIILETPGDDFQRFFRLGAADFCLAPLRLGDLLPRLVRWSMPIQKTNVFARDLEQKLGLQQFLGESPAFVEAINRIPKLARCDASVFITGETGTGKEMCARAIHQLGHRANHSFVPVNCGAIPLELLENELFGHEVGAFTGASMAARGLVHDAEGGTIFLDEIDSLPSQMQVKLLRFLQDHEYRPLGARKIFHANIRIIAASNADLEAVVRSGKFRADLFYRLNILALKLPALRERRGDIRLLARHFITKYSREFSLPTKELSRTALEKLLAHDWPGNVRELENILERAILGSEQSMITGEDICLPRNCNPEEELSFKTFKAHAIAELEVVYVRRLLAENDGNISKAARAAKKNRRAFWELMRKHAIVATSVASHH
jgi:two-component system response regulator GlrR